MSVEGMWKFQSGSVAAPSTPVWGGIVVLESGRVFGGDSVMAYLGSFEIDRGVINAKVRSWIWNTDLPAEQLTNVFGMEGAIDFVAQLKGEIRGNEIVGELWPIEAPTFKVLARMEKIAELP